MADELKRKFNLEIKFIEGSGGIFDVWYKDELIFSKHQVYRFPESGEVLSIIDRKIN